MTANATIATFAARSTYSRRNLSLPDVSTAWGPKEEKETPGIDCYSSFEFAEKMEAEARKLVNTLHYLESLDSLLAKERVKIRREIPKSEKVLRMWERLKASHPKRNGRQTDRIGFDILTCPK